MTGCINFWMKPSFLTLIPSKLAANDTSLLATILQIEHHATILTVPLVNLGSARNTLTGHPIKRGGILQTGVFQYTMVKSSNESGFAYFRRVVKELKRALFSTFFFVDS